MEISSLSVQDMTTYLKNVMETESSLFKQRMVKQEAKNCLHFEKPKKKKIKQPQMEYIHKPEPPSDEPDEPIAFVGFGVLAAMSIIGGLCAFSWGGIWSGMLLISLGVFFIWTIKVAKERNESIEESTQQYPRELLEYEKKVAKAKENFARAQSAYEERMKAEEQRYNLALRATYEHYSMANEQVQQLDKPLKETEAVLQSLYDLDIIFPKYRNLPAVCMFYEYFASGRCSELVGANGAYNLYEAELRQNLIINKLDAILGSLEGIKQNQFILYTEVKKAADALPMITRDVNGMLDTTQNISQSAAIAAQCAEATKVNTEALKYLAFIKR